MALVIAGEVLFTVARVCLFASNNRKNGCSYYSETFRLDGHRDRIINGHMKTAQQRTIILQYRDWYTGVDWWAVTFGTT